MPRPRSHIPITCQNSACRFYLVEEGKDIVKNGTTSCGHQQYFCKHCRTYFVETKNTPFYRSHLEYCQIETICRHGAEKISIRGVSRITGHHQDTISRYYKLFGEHAEVLNEFFLQDLTPDRIEADEIWTFIQKKQKLQRTGWL